ncbi:MAG: DUF1015 domain-containing protein [Desulfobacteraceae bacterium]|nr:DUF1015 domain-containing protein [Desulfobacteraceae bacterium]
MAEIIAFRGILYNTEKIKNISDVVTPPYDVISDKERDAFYDRHPNNAVRLDKGKPENADTDQDNPHTRASTYFQHWMKDSILVEDSDPALYLTSVEFTVAEKPVTRFGLIARVRLEPFDKGIVLPHEKTFSKVKTERLELIKACRANFSQIFSIFSDPENILGLLTSATENMAPVFDFNDDAGHRHKLWRITDPSMHQKVSDAFKEKKLFIADGHHRYETALNYKKWLIKNDPKFNSDHPANYTMMYLCSIQDPGLVILPTHRLLTTISKETQNSFLQTAETFFDIENHSFNPSDLVTTQQRLDQAMTASGGEHKFGVFIKDRQEFYVLKLKTGVMDSVFGSEINAPLKELDVIVLTRLIFVKLLGFDDDMLDDHDLINFSSKEIDAITAATDGTHDMTFILNPTKNDQVTRIAEKGLIMPRKSTYYFPKAISGQVMRSLTS